MKHTVLTLVIALFLVFDFQVGLYPKNGETEYFYVWLCCGIPFGIRRMFFWLVPHGYDIGGTVGIIAVNFIVGGLIGGVILTWRLVVAVWYILPDYLPIAHELIRISSCVLKCWGMRRKVKGKSRELWGLFFLSREYICVLLSFPLESEVTYSTNGSAAYFSLFA